MSELISRESLLKKYDAEHRGEPGRARRLIEEEPTVEERKKGKWIKEYWNGEHTRKCSACNITQTVTTYRGKVNFNFCPYCGADMRGAEHGKNGI